jgi:beta-lactamase class A
LIQITKMKKYFVLILFCFSIPQTLLSQDVTIPDYYIQDGALGDSLHAIVQRIGLDQTFDIGEYGTETISLAVIDLTGADPKIAGINMDNFIYPASVYKMYAAAEVLHQVSNGDYSLYEPVVVLSPNDVDRRISVPNDPRSVPRAGDTLNVNYLLDLMITTSSNTAANCLIDIATRERINEFMHSYGWHGSEVTRKFLSRDFEDPGYNEIRGTETCALHAADFLYRIYTNRLINPWVSQHMMTLLGRQLDKSKLATGLPGNAMFYHKSGWWSYWTNDVGIVDDGVTRFIIAAFFPIRQVEALEKFTLLAEEVFRLIQSSQN